ncbi:unnamed protein product [Strongylus vulgaris]|uniref:Uncharacterized protein n=1 Tax=Strongylus vulgaris TaxID=40348 RepID=A0A3P7KYY2_STRVU|nr:unnamed protein product [Strongylus vulgaris]
MCRNETTKSSNDTSTSYSDTSTSSHEMTTDYDYYIEENYYNYYNPTFVRRIMFPLSAAAHSSNPEDCIKTIDHGEKEIKNVTVYGKLDNSSSGYTAVLPERTAIVIGFR